MMVLQEYKVRWQNIRKYEKALKDKQQVDILLMFLIQLKRTNQK
jgi:hypothetical protein